MAFLKGTAIAPIGQVTPYTRHIPKLIVKFKPYKPPGSGKGPRLQFSKRTRRPAPLTPHKGAIALPYLQNPKQKSARIFFLFFPLSIAGASVERMNNCSPAARDHGKFVNDFNGPLTTLCEQ